MQMLEVNSQEEFLLTLPVLNILMTDEGSEPISAQDSWRGFQKAQAHGYRQFYIKSDKDEETIIGVIGIRPFYDPLETSSGYEINNFAVIPEYRSQGIGTKLFEHAMQIPKAENANWVRIWVYNHNNRAQKFYKKQDFNYFADFFLWENT